MASECHVHLLDVGQGSSTVILYPDSQTGESVAIVIDCGPAPDAKIPMLVLEDFADRIAALVLTHNHADHVGGRGASGAEEIIRSYFRERPEENRLGHIVFLHDGTKVFVKLFSLLEEIGALRKWVRLERDSTRQVILDEEDGPKLEVLWPWASDSETARMRVKPNDASGVLRLTYQDRHLLFGSDSSRQAWEAIRDEFDRLPCDAVTVPHHGGRMDSSVPAPDVAEFFFSRAVDADVAFFSVGSRNSYGHPFPGVVGAAKGAGSDEDTLVVLCSQITKRCCLDDSNRMSELAGDSLISPTPYSQSFYAKGQTACAGSASLILSDAGVSWGNGGEPGVCGFQTLSEHDSAIERLAKHGGTPLCRQTAK